MTQAKFVVPKMGQARVIIKSNSQDELPTFELDWEIDKNEALLIMAYAMKLRGAREQTNPPKGDE